MFKAPIPGQSLTTTPKNAPYERPPQFVEPDKALAKHLEHLTEDDRMDKIMQLLERGVDVQTMTEGLLRSAVANGLHSVDVSLIIGPVIHEYLKATASKVGIDFKEGPAFDKKDDAALQAKAGKEEAFRRLKKGLPKIEESTTMTPEESTPEVPQEAPSKGLMKRR